MALFDLVSRTGVSNINNIYSNQIITIDLNRVNLLPFGGDIYYPFQLHPLQEHKIFN